MQAAIDDKNSQYTGHPEFRPTPSFPVILHAPFVTQVQCDGSVLETAHFQFDGHKISILQHFRVNFS